jgi:hypothetical protein
LLVLDNKAKGVCAVKTDKQEAHSYMIEMVASELPTELLKIVTPYKFGSLDRTFISLKRKKCRFLFANSENLKTVHAALKRDKIASVFHHQWIDEAAAEKVASKSEQDSKKLKLEKQEQRLRLIKRRGELVGQKRGKISQKRDVAEEGLGKPERMKTAKRQSMKMVKQEISPSYFVKIRKLGLAKKMIKIYEDIPSPKLEYYFEYDGGMKEFSLAFNKTDVQYLTACHRLFVAYGGETYRGAGLVRLITQINMRTKIGVKTLNKIADDFLKKVFDEKGESGMKGLANRCKGFIEMNHAIELKNPK